VAPPTARMPTVATARRVWSPSAEHPWRLDMGAVFADLRQAQGAKP
jgi:hypothetical protein